MIDAVTHMGLFTQYSIIFMSVACVPESEEKCSSNRSNRSLLRLIFNKTSQKLDLLKKKEKKKMLTRKDAFSLFISAMKNERTVYVVHALTIQCIEF